jgi:predicted aminopeptidase
MRLFLTAFNLLLAILLTGCADGRYLLQSVSGHLELMYAARPLEQWLVDPLTPPQLQVRLDLAQRMRSFAVTELGLPDNVSYHRYADLHRRSVVWNVVAAPEWSLTLKTWCFPVVGCVGYRGYFDEAQARAAAAQLKAEGLEVSVYGVPAYSTLGWMNWAGGDPLLSTFINYPEGELARMIFHELAHQVLYVKDDTAFNESFATAVERRGSARWLDLHGSPAARAEYALFDGRRTGFRALTQATRRALAAIYEQNEPLAPVDSAQAAMKMRVMKDFREQYAQLKSGWMAASGRPADAFSGYDAWVANANNAALGAQAAYDDLVPVFDALFEREARGESGAAAWHRIYDAVRRLADLAPTQRAEALGQIKQQMEAHGG